MTNVIKFDCDGQFTLFSSGHIPFTDIQITTLNDVEFHCNLTLDWLWLTVDHNRIHPSESIHPNPLAFSFVILMDFISGLLFGSIDNQWINYGGKDLLTCNGVGHRLRLPSAIHAVPETLK